MNSRFPRRCQYAILLFSVPIAAACFGDGPPSPKQTFPITSVPAEPTPRKGPADAKVKDLIAVLETGNEEARFEAAMALADLGPQAAGAVPALIKELRRDANGTQASLDALVRIGPDAVPALTMLINDRDHHVRRAARDALAEIGPEAASAIPVLLESLGGEEDPIRSWRIRQTAWCGVAVGSTYGSVVDVLSAMQWKAVPQLAQALAHEHRSVRGGAAFALGQIGREAKDAVPALIDALKQELSRPTPDGDLWSMYVWALGEIGPPARAAVPLLQKTLAEYKPPKGDGKYLPSVLRRADPFTMAAAALTNISPHDPSTLAIALDRLKRERLPPFSGAHTFWSDFGAVGAKELAALAKHNTPRVRRTARGALYSMNLKDVPDAVAAMPDMIALLDDHKLRWAAMGLLGDIGPPAKAALPRILALLSSEEARGSWGAAAGAVLRIDPGNARAIAYFVQELKSSDRERREEALDDLRKIGSPAQATVPALIECLKDNDPEFRAEVAMVLGYMKPVAKGVVSALAGVIHDQSHPDVSIYHLYGPIYALANIGPEALPVLIRALDDEELASDAVVALGLMGPAAQPAVAKLVAMLDKRPRCADTLGEIGPGAKAAVPNLERLLRHKRRWVRESAREALGRIHSPTAR